MEKFSFSKIDTFEQCPYKFHLVYKEKHFISDKNIAQDFGTLIHFIEESIANKIKELGNEFQFLFNVNEFIDLFINLDDPKNKVFGMKKLKQMYPLAFNEKDKTGLDYTDKGNIYLEKGILRLYNFLLENPNLEILDTEKEFNLNYNEKYIFHGFIDRVFRNKLTNEIYIEDIKTYNSPLEKDKLTTPLQFVFYTLAAKEIYNVPIENISCAYEIPLCDIKQSAGTKGFITRGVKKIDKLLNQIESGVMNPNSTPLCHWCVFSETYPNQPEEAKNLCPYFSHWTKQNKDFSVENEWQGDINHPLILEAFRNRNQNIQDRLKTINIEKPIILIKDNERRFLLRRN